MKIEKRGIEQVPENKRNSKPSELFWPWFAGNISTFGISYGAYVLAFGLTAVQAILAAGIGIIGSFFLVGLASLAGKKGSAPVMILNRGAFGVDGSKITAVLSWLYVVGWEIILSATATLVIAPSLQRFFPNINIKLTNIISLLVICFLIVFVAFIGYKLVIRVQKAVTIIGTIITIIYVVLSAHTISFHRVFTTKSTFLSGEFVGAIAFCFIGIGIGWINAASDFTRYQPSHASSKKIVFWTIFGGATPVYLLLIYGVFLTSSDPSLTSKITENPVGALTSVLPTWFVVPFALLSIVGLMSGTILDIYSSGLALITTGIPIKRYVMVFIDGTIMFLGAGYIIFFSPSFMTSFQSFLSTVGVPILAWSGIFVGDTLLRTKLFDSKSLYDRKGAYGSFNAYSWVLMFLSCVIGFGFVKSDIFKFEGYLYKLFNLDNTAWAHSNIGLFIAMGISMFGTLILAKKRVKRQELKY